MATAASRGVAGDPDVADQHVPDRRDALRAQAARNHARYVANRGAAFAIAAKFSMTRGERIELVTVLFDRNVDSWADLSPDEWGRLREGLECAALVCSFQMQRRSGERR